MSSGLIRFFVASFLAAAAVVPHAGFAQQQAPATAPSTPAPTSPSPTPAVPPAVQEPAAPSPVPAKPAEAPSATNPAAAPPGAAAQPAQPGAASGEGSTGESVDLPARPFAYVEGKADKDEIYSAILNSLSSVKREIDKASLAPAGRPLAIFVESDDTGFKFHAGYPLAAAPEGKSSLSDT